MVALAITSKGFTQCIVQALEYYNNILCMEAKSDLIDTGIMSQSNYDQLVNRGQIKVVRSGGGVGRSALVAYNSLPVRFQQKIEQHLGASPYDLTDRNSTANEIETDYQAFEFFSTYRYPDGSAISCERQNNILLWANNASVLNAVVNDLNRHTEERESKGKRPLYSQFYAKWTAQIKSPALQNRFENNLPTNPRRLRAKVEDYKANGYDSLIKHNKGNQNARKVSKPMENLILSLYSMKNKPYAKTVHKMYIDFIEGKHSIVDQGTGEIFDSAAFTENGQPTIISEATIWNIINNPANRIIVDRLRNDAKYYKDRHEPHHHRQRAQYSLSKVSMDDRDIPNSEAKAYYAFDVMSGCIIGRSYSTDKDMNLVMECFRNMFAFLQHNNLGTPLEVEVEQHLMNRLADTVLAEGLLFNYIRWCAPGNSQEKWAEYGIRFKKLQQEKYFQEGIGRFYSKLEANRPPQVGEWSTGKMRVKDRKRTYEKAVAEDLYTIEKYNNAPHPHIAGKTRMQVLLENVNPKVARIDNALLAKIIGYSTKTTIKRTQSVTVQYKEYQLPHSAIMHKLKPNKKTVDAFYLPTDEGQIESVYLYQDDTFICEAKPIEKYSIARAEWDTTDEEALTEQAKYVEKHRKMVKDGVNGLSKLTIIENDEELSPDADDSVEVFVAQTPTDNDISDDYDDYDDSDPYEAF